MWFWFIRNEQEAGFIIFVIKLLYNHSVSSSCIFLCMHTFFLYSAKARTRVTDMINNAIVHYREDIDLQNLIDFGQKEVRIYSKYRLHTINTVRHHHFVIHTRAIMYTHIINMSSNLFYLKCLYVSSVWLLWWCDVH